MSYSVVWFKRDLRWSDHAALAHAASLGPVRCLYVVEPALWAQADAALQHFEFVRESLLELQSALRAHGGDLVVRVGSVVSVLAELHAQSLEDFDQVLGRIRLLEGISQTETSLLLSTVKL
mgnify:CR=1 FL=1